MKLLTKPIQSSQYVGNGRQFSWQMGNDNYF